MQCASQVFHSIANSAHAINNRLLIFPNTSQRYLDRDMSGQGFEHRPILPMAHCERPKVKTKQEPTLLLHKHSGRTRPTKVLQHYAQCSTGKTGWHWHWYWHWPQRRFAPKTAQIPARARCPMTASNDVKSVPIGRRWLQLQGNAPNLARRSLQTAKCSLQVPTLTTPWANKGESTKNQP